MVSSGSSHQSESMLTLARRVCLNYCLIKAIFLHSLFLAETMLCKEPVSIQMAQGCYGECIYALMLSADVQSQYRSVHVHLYGFVSQFCNTSLFLDNI